MTKYVALLRGINVGGHNKLKMAELRDALQPLGLKIFGHIFKVAISCSNQVNLKNACNSKFKKPS